MLKFWAFIYRRTGFIHSSIKIAEYNYIRKNINRIEQKYLQEMKNHMENNEPIRLLDDIIGLEIGLYQMRLGLYVYSKHLHNYEKNFTKKILIIFKRLFNI